MTIMLTEEACQECRHEATEHDSTGCRHALAHACGDNFECVCQGFVA